MGGLLALAFTAGTVAPINPCGFVLLPAWIALSLGSAETAPLHIQLVHALRAGLGLAIGFAGTLALVGVVVSLGARSTIQAFPWLGLTTGFLLLLLGSVMLSGRSVSLRLPRPSQQATTTRRPFTRMLLFGGGFAAASLSCTVGVLLALIGQAAATANYASLLLVFAAYAAGSATVLLLIALTPAFAGAAFLGRVTAMSRYTPRLVAVVVLLTGAYLAWYWYPEAVGGPTAAARTGGLASLAAGASNWIQGHSGLVLVLALVASAAALAVALLLRHRGPGTAGPPTVEDPSQAACESCAPAAEQQRQADGAAQSLADT